MLRPGEVGHEGAAAHGDENLLRRQRLAVAGQTDRVRPGDRRAGLMDFDAGAFEIAAVDVLQPQDLRVLALNEARPVEGPIAHGPAEAGRVMEMLRELACVDHQLLRHAAADDAGAAEAILFSAGDARAVASRNPRGAHAAGAAADDEKIVVVVSVGHGRAPSLGVPL